MKAILASQNVHKAQEFAAAIHSLQVVPAPHGVDVDENALDFIGNARLKARAYAAEFAQNALADDSGLCVDALNGAPGIHSQRFAVMGNDVDNDPDRTAANNRKLLRQLANVPESNRSAHFSCALCLVIVEQRNIAPMIEIARRTTSPKVKFSFYDADNREVEMDSDDIVRVELVLEAQAPGRILTEKHGQEGFGYDPLFYCPEVGCTFAELTCEQKLAVSHRGRAIALLRKIME